MRAFRRRLRIKARGENVPDCLPSFSLLPCPDASLKRTLLRNIESSQWKEPTPIQMQALPVLAMGRDLLATAPTGSGKTAAFVLPTLLRLEKSEAKLLRNGPRALLLAPTRELASQICGEVQRLAAGRAFKVAVVSKALAATKDGAGQGVFSGYDLLVATPMRLLQALREGKVDLRRVRAVILDEADKLFELGREGKKNTAGESLEPDKSFLGQVDEILAACTYPEVQRALFSATLPPLIHDLASSVLRDPVSVSVGLASNRSNYTHAAAVPESVTQELVFVGREEGKLLALRQLLKQGVLPPILVFLESKERARELYHELCYDHLRVDVMHAGRSSEQRAALLEKVRAGAVWVLLCTDLCARGLDLRAVNVVVNYDLPPSCVTYVHRVGRTGRAGRAGRAVTFWTERDMEEGGSLRAIANVIKLSGGQVPAWMAGLKKGGKKKGREGGREGGRVRGRISTRTAWDVEKAKRRKERRPQKGGGTEKK
jgi:ATP-dependent RNA helicase DDX52/ROK1